MKDDSQNESKLFSLARREMEMGKCGFHALRVYSVQRGKKG
jgi:hypothetical protein